MKIASPACSTQPLPFGTATPQWPGVWPGSGTSRIPAGAPASVARPYQFGPGSDSSFSTCGI